MNVDSYLLEVLDGLSDVYNRPPLGVNGVKIYASMLSGYSIEQLGYAFEMHQKDPKEGAFFPKPANLLKHLEGDLVSEDEVIAMARLADTPLGILCRIHIGTFDLDNSADHFYLKSRASECLALLGGWKERAKNGDFSDHEMQIMLKHKVNPSSPFYIGLASPKCSNDINTKAKQVYNSEEFKALTAPKEEESEGVDEEGLRKIRDIVNGVISN